ncbi:MAG: chemotaxis protein CheB, partial [Microlunatus sp.]|nr:chemotaxis protein CheB [Microlunatus sp.]
MAATGQVATDVRQRDIVVVGASAGGVESLKALFAGLPRRLKGSLLIVLHVPSSGTSMLPKILGRVGTIPVQAAPGADSRLQLGEALVAPPGYHLMLVDDHVVLTRGPLENGHRPAIDVLFRSAARAADGRVIGVVLSGALDDGTAGMMAIRQRGGLVLAEDPGEALYPSMPRSVINNVGADHVASATRLGELVGELCGTQVPDHKAESSPLLDMEVGLATMRDDAMNAADRPGQPSGFSCPNCNGTLFEIEDGGVRRYRCRV